MFYIRQIDWDGIRKEGIFKEEVCCAFDKVKNLVHYNFQDSQKNFSKERIEAVLKNKYDLEELSQIDLLLNHSKKCFENGSFGVECIILFFCSYHRTAAWVTFC